MKKVRDIKSIFAASIATAAGAGLSPVAPGTMGSLVGIPLAYWTQDGSALLRVLVWVGIFGSGVWSARVFDQKMGTQDNQAIVIDEVVGMAIAAWTAGTEWKTWCFAFVAFRVFDILKPPPIRIVDRWSKKQKSPAWGGWGVMLDDVIAGVEALVIVILFQKLGFLASSGTG